MWRGGPASRGDVRSARRVVQLGDADLRAYIRERPDAAVDAAARP